MAEQDIPFPHKRIGALDIQAIKMNGLKVRLYGRKDTDLYGYAVADGCSGVVIHVPSISLCDLRAWDA